MTLKRPDAENENSNGRYREIINAPNKTISVAVASLPRSFAYSQQGVARMPRLR